MIIESETLAINSRAVLYVISDKEAGIGEIGLSDYGESPIVQLKVSPEAALSIRKSWIESEKERDEYRSTIRTRRRYNPPKRKPAKKGVKK